MTSISAITNSTSNPIQSNNSTNPVIVYIPDAEDILKLDVSILNSNNTERPQSVQLAIFACAEPPGPVTRPGVNAVSGTGNFPSESFR